MSSQCEDLSRFERIALRFYRRTRQAPDSSDSQAQSARIDLGKQIARMRDIERGAIKRAALAGALSGLCVAIAALLADPLLTDPQNTGLNGQVAYWAIVLAVTGLATVLEVGFLFWDALRSARAIGAVAEPNCALPAENSGRQDLILTRAGLELPEPTHPVFGIDPLLEANRWRLLLWALLYKAKVGLTSFLVKTAIKRIAGRALARGYVEFLAIPVLAIWNAVVCRWVMREVRIRALGPQIVALQFQRLFMGGCDTLEPEEQIAIFLAIKSKIVHAQGFHPNVLLFLERFFEESKFDVNRCPAQTQLLLELPKFRPEVQRLALEVLAVVIALDGRATRGEFRILAELRAAANLPYDRNTLREAIAGHVALLENEEHARSAALRSL